MLYYKARKAIETLHRIVILNRTWATKAIYKVIRDATIHKQHCGQFGIDDLRRLWKGEVYENHIPELVQLMQRFEVCYALETKTERYLIPQRLPEIPQVSDLEKPPKTDYIHLKYSYNYLPAGLVNRLAVRLSKHIKHSTEVWQFGVRLCHGKGSITVVEDRFNINGKIDVYLTGDKEDRYFLQLKVQQELKELHEIYNITDEEETVLSVPCSCSDCLRADKPYFYDYHYSLIRRIKRGIPNITCEQSFKLMPITQLIDYVFYKEPEEVTQAKKEREQGGFQQNFYGETHIHRQDNIAGDKHAQA